jgi:hypothetical protein
MANPDNGRLEDRDPQAPEVTIIHHPPPKEELPADRAELIIAGTLTNAQAFFSANHGALYTESTIQVEKVFGQIGRQVRVGDTLTLLQDGGALQLSTDRVIKHGVHGSGNELQVKNRYVFFLVYIPGLEAYGCTKAWLLSGGRVVAVSSDDLARVAANKSTYEGYSEADLFSVLATLKPSWNPAAPH